MLALLAEAGAIEVDKRGHVIICDDLRFETVAIGKRPPLAFHKTQPPALLTSAVVGCMSGLRDAVAALSKQKHCLRSTSGSWRRRMRLRPLLTTSQRMFCAPYSLATMTPNTLPMARARWLRAGPSRALRGERGVEQVRVGRLGRGHQMGCDGA